MAHTTIASFALLIWRALEGYGIDPRPVFEGQGLDPDLIQAPRARYAVPRLREVWMDAVEQSGDPCFGLEAARHWHPTMWHALGIAWLASHTLKDGFERIARYGEMISTAADCRLQRVADGYRFSVGSRASDLTPAPETLEAVMAIFVRMSRMSAGEEFSPLSVSLARPPTVCVARLREFFGCEVIFDASVSDLVIRAEDADCPLPSQNAELLLASDTMIAEYLAGMRTADISTRARSLIARDLSSGAVTDESLAAELNMSVRTFQRRLQDEGTTYKKLLEEVRRDLARRYIEDERLSITEISYLLGFSEPSSFARVFKRWTGQAPSTSRVH